MADAHTSWVGFDLLAMTKSIPYCSTAVTFSGSTTIFWLLPVHFTQLLYGSQVIHYQPGIRVILTKSSIIRHYEEIIFLRLNFSGHELTLIYQGLDGLTVFGLT